MRGIYRAGDIVSVAQSWGNGRQLASCYTALVLCEPFGGEYSVMDLAQCVKRMVEAHEIVKLLEGKAMKEALREV